MILHHLGQLAANRRIPDLPIYVDSPMALAALRVYRDAVTRGDPDIRPDVPAFDARLPHGLSEVRDVEGSRALNTRTSRRS